MGFSTSANTSNTWFSVRSVILAVFVKNTPYLTAKCINDIAKAITMQCTMHNTMQCPMHCPMQYYAVSYAVYLQEKISHQFNLFS